MSDHAFVTDVSCTICRLFCIQLGLHQRASGIFGKVGRIASEEVVLHLITSLCPPVWSCLGGHIAISGCCSLLLLFGDTFFDVAIVGMLDFVT